MAEMLDTQVISYAMKGSADVPVTDRLIPSVVAKEFLLLKPLNPTEATYYIPNLTVDHFASLLHLSRKRHHFHKRLSDSIVLDLGHQYGSVVEYCDFAISRAINERAPQLFMSGIAFLPKEQQKLLRKRFTFLLENNIRCVPLTASSVDIGLELLARFDGHHTIKRDFRNSLNDILILATALDAGSPLVTSDKELSRFTNEEQSRVVEGPGETVTIEPRAKSLPNSDTQTESKGYINRGWRFKLDRGNS